MVQAVGTVGRTLAGRNFWRHLACGDNAMQCMVLTTYRCILWTEITCYLALGNSTSRNRILTQDLQLKFEIWYSCFHNLQYLCENNMQIC